MLLVASADCPCFLYIGNPCQTEARDKRQGLNSWNGVKDPNDLTSTTLLTHSIPSSFSVQWECICKAVHLPYLLRREGHCSSFSGRAGDLGGFLFGWGSAPQCSEGCPPAVRTDELLCRTCNTKDTLKWMLQYINASACTYLFIYFLISSNLNFHLPV